MLFFPLSLKYIVYQDVTEYEHCLGFFKSIIFLGYNSYVYVCK